MIKAMYRLITLACATALLVGCGGDKESAEAKEAPAMPFERVAAGDEDPADNGPGDDTELDGVPFSMGAAKFKHFTHASNSEKGFGIPCVRCHHNVTDPDDSGPCSECHKAPEKGQDPAHFGPDDNTVLKADDGRALPVPFNHFTHASSKGYKLSCATCHHKDDYLGPCSDCHGEVAVVEDGNVVPKLKRAFHSQCKGCHEALVKSNPQAKAPVKCGACHRDGVIHRGPGALELQRAYHLSCIGCHLDVAKARPDTGAPTNDCSGCHPDGSAEMPGASAPAKEVEEKVAEKPAEEPQPEAEAEAKAGDAGTGEEEASAGDDAKGPAEIKLAGSDEGKKTKAFKHHEHHDYADGCKTCHHQGMDEPSCTGACHEPEEAKKIYHKQCRDCHVENGVDNKCSFCHL